ncbi:hypothetical protein CAEBREN_24749 [Caenorhabditis brenneri]|uniref:GH18 domain-containing protein n=1 Tax=Caenorhabditis brenneri TaxID=135651 RepID=G0P9X2_CAEBE|nr:hypothetical protein CAEBREN_24749 [Caenorhabditis brenneri]
MESSEWMDYYSDSECDGAYYGNFLSDTDSTKTKKSCFKKLRALLFFGIVGTALFGSLLIYFTVVSPLLFSADQNSTSAQPAANAPEAQQPLKPSCITKRVVGYYPGSLEVNTAQLQKLTHIIFEYVKLDRGHILKFENKTSEERFLEMKKKAREVNEDLKVMISIGAKDQSNEFQIFLSDEIYRP